MTDAFRATLEEWLRSGYLTSVEVERALRMLLTEFDRRGARLERMQVHLDRLEGENARLDAERLTAMSELVAEMLRCNWLLDLVERLTGRALDERLGALAVDPDAPRRFEFDDFGEWGRDRRRGCYFPTTNVWASDMGTSHFGGPQVPGVRFLDPCPAPAPPSEVAPAPAEPSPPARSEGISPES